jgi:TctA family transporter
LYCFIGFNPVIGGLRFTFGTIYLWDGLRLAPVFIGLFAISTALDLAVSGEKIVKEGVVLKKGLQNMIAGFKAPIQHFGLFIKSSIIGTLIGIIPGVGGVVAGFLAYGQAVQTSKDKSLFGNGDIRGVIAPETSNNAKEGGSLVPTLAFGIPGSEAMAILLSAFLIHGVTPGPEMLTEKIADIWLIIIVLIVASLIASVIAIVVSTQLIKATRVSPFYLSPIIITAGLVGAYGFNSDIVDVLVTLIIGIFGYFTNKFNVPKAPMIIAYILGGLMERSFFQTIQMGRGSFSVFFHRPIALGLVLLVVITALVPYISSIRQKHR